MLATKIRQLCRLLPPPELDVVPDNFQMGIEESLLGVSDPEEGRFLRAYKDLQFGWNAARTLALNEVPFTIPLDGSDLWTWKAYLYCLDKKYKDPMLTDAMGFMNRPYAKERAVINSLLMSYDMTVEKIAKKLNKPVEVIQAYESLFFNIMDRREDHLFISSIIYPESRLVEAHDRYVTSEALEMLLMRAGYNNGSNDALYLAGFPSRLLEQTQGKDTPQRLESLFLANALIMARNGWINQGPTSGYGLYHARALITAAKMSGQESGQSPFASKTAGAIMMAEVQRVKTQAFKYRAEKFYSVQNAGEK